MSNLVVSDLNGVAVNRQVVTASCNFSSLGGITIRESFNILAITDLGVGVFSPMFEEDMDNLVWTMTTSGGMASSSAQNGAQLAEGLDSNNGNAARTLNSFQLRCITASASAFFDGSYLQFHIFGGKS